MLSDRPIRRKMFRINAATHILLQMVSYWSANDTCRWPCAAKAFTMPIHRRGFTTALNNTHVDLRPEAKAPLGQGISISAEAK
jgi:hypothetical protein